MSKAMSKYIKLFIFFNIAFIIIFTSCTKSQKINKLEPVKNISSSLTYDHRLKLDYAEQFAIDYYNNDYTLITISDGSRFFIVPENMSVPKDLDNEITIIKQPVNNIYLAASAVMDMFCSLDALDTILLSGIKKEGWVIEKAKKYMENGKISYAGKYNAPDYEKIVDTGCSLAIESTMIFHSPEVKEKLESFGISVLVDYSSYEKHPLGRTEWVKLYGALLGKKEKANQAFTIQKKELDNIISKENTGKTVAFFYITSNETANVRKSGDYVPRMIELAGGNYIFSNLGNNSNASSTINMQMEEFYNNAKEADYLIYNSTIDDSINSIDELLAKSSLLKDFKAVREGNVFCTTKNLYQNSMKLGTFISDIHNMLTLEDSTDETFQYMFKLE